MLGRQTEADDGEYRFYFRYVTDIEGKGPGATLFDVILNPKLALDVSEAQVPIDNAGNMVGVSELLQAHLDWARRYRETGNLYA